MCLAVDRAKPGTARSRLTSEVRRRNKQGRNEESGPKGAMTAGAKEHSIGRSSGAEKPLLPLTQNTPRRIG